MGLKFEESGRLDSESAVCASGDEEIRFSGLRLLQYMIVGVGACIT